MRTTKDLWQRFAMAWMMVAAITAANGAESGRPTLTGRVLLPDGSPISNATVFVYTAGPRTGTGVVCPSCYADCAKKSRTSTQGEFTLASLDPKLVFRLLAIAPGCEPKFLKGVDPAHGGNANITMLPISPERLKSTSRIKGMVMDPSGKPLAGATISPEGVTTGSSSSWGGTDRFVDPLAVTDEQGRFQMSCTNSIDRVHAVVEGRGVAKRWVELKPGRDHLVRMQDGVIITGTVRHDGRPVAGAIMSFVTKDLTSGKSFQGEEVATDKAGAFLLPNLPPEREFVVYAKMGSLAGNAVLPSRLFTTGASGTRQSLAAIEAAPGHRVAGRVVLSTGRRLPAQTRLLLGREEAWDHTEAMLDADGRFEFLGVPAESVGLNVRVPGYKFSKRNGSLDWLNGGLVGRVTGDITDLNLLMEPGQWRHNGEEGDPPDGDSQPREKPLRGADRGL